MAMSSAPARPDSMRPVRRTVQIRGHVPPPPQPAKSMSLRDVPVAPRKVPTRALVSAAPVPNVRNAPLAGAGAGGTGTVLLTPRRRRSRSVGERVAGSPDRLAMWAFVMAVFLVLVATLSAH
jgi:hypothetical protein